MPAAYHLGDPRRYPGFVIQPQSAEPTADAAVGRTAVGGGAGCSHARSGQLQEEWTLTGARHAFPSP